MKVTTTYKETENYHRFEIKQTDMNGRIYIRKGVAIPLELIVELNGPHAKGDMAASPLLPEMGTEETFIENRDQAQALANFLWNEMERHKEDTKEIKKDLEVLKEKWHVAPILRRIFARSQVQF